MSIKYFNSQEEMDDDFERICELNDNHLLLKEEVERAEEVVVEARYQIEIAEEELEYAEGVLIEAQKELQDFELNHQSELL